MTYVTIKEAAIIVGCSEKTVWAHAKAGHLGAMIREVRTTRPSILLLENNVRFALAQGILKPSRIPPAIILIDAEWLARCGETGEQTYLRLGYATWDALERFLYRHHRGDIVKQLVRNSHQRGVSVRGVTIGEEAAA